MFQTPIHQDETLPVSYAFKREEKKIKPHTHFLLYRMKKEPLQVPTTYTNPLSHHFTSHVYMQKLEKNKSLY